MAEDINALWQELKQKWAILKSGSGASDEDKENAKKRINEIQKKLDLDITNWDEKNDSKSKSSTTSSTTATATSSKGRKVEWPTMDINQQEVNDYLKTVSTAVVIVKTIHPDMDMNSDVFGTIISATTGHLIAMRS